MSAKRPSSRFRIRLDDGSEVPVASVEALSRRIERHEVLPDTQLFDGSTGEWAAAGDCSIARFIVDELIREGQLLPEEWTVEPLEPAEAEPAVEADVPVETSGSDAGESPAGMQTLPPEFSSPIDDPHASVEEATASGEEASDSTEGASDPSSGRADPHGPMESVSAEELPDEIVSGDSGRSDGEPDPDEIPDLGATVDLDSLSSLDPEPSIPSDPDTLVDADDLVDPDDMDFPAPDITSNLSDLDSTSASDTPSDVSSSSGPDEASGLDAPSGPEDGDFHFEGFTLADEEQATSEAPSSPAGDSAFDEDPGTVPENDDFSLAIGPFGDDDTGSEGSSTLEPGGAGSPASDDPPPTPRARNDDPWGREVPEPPGPALGPDPADVREPASTPPRRRRASLLLLALAAAVGLLIDQWVGGWAGVTGPRPIPGPAAIAVADQPPPPPPELEQLVNPALDEISSRFQETVDSLRVAHGVPEGPPGEWLGGYYLSNAGQFPGMRVYWEGYANVIDDLAARDNAIFGAAIEAVVEGYPETDADHLRGYLRARYAYAREAREARYHGYAAIAVRALELHAFLQERQDELQFTPAVGVAMPLDPVLEVGTQDAELRLELNRHLDGFLDALYRARGGGSPAAEGLEEDLFPEFATF